MKKLKFFGVLALICTCLLVSIFLFRDNGIKVQRIGIGGGGSFFNPMIDPTNENIYYVTSDMGALYYSYNQGKSWARTEARAVFAQTHIAKNGVVFAGGCGVYASFNKGKDLTLIYPQNVKHMVSRCGWNENLMLAEGYNNGYVKCITSNSNYVFFVTLDWEGKLELIKTDYNGDGKEVLYTTQTSYLDPMSDVDMQMFATNDGIYINFGTKIVFYNFVAKDISDLYFAKGYIKDICKIENTIFFIDDKNDVSEILYTNNFVNFNDLLEFNTLGNKFTKYGRDGTFNWHFKAICGNNFNNIFLSFSSPVNEYDDVVDGILKFNGQTFEWVFDSMFKNNVITPLKGWSYGCHGPFYGIAENPHDDNSCLVANIESVYFMEYKNEEKRAIHRLHCNEHSNDTYSTNGLDVQTTYFVKEDPFNKNHIIICTTDLGLQNSYDNGKTWKRMEITQTDYDIYNTCYDLHFDMFNKNVLYGLFSSRHDAPYNPLFSDVGHTKGALAISYDGGNTWDFSYSQGLPTDCIPVKLSVIQTETEFRIAVATFNRGFYYSTNGGKNFKSINSDITKHNELIFGEDIVLTDTKIFCLTAPYLVNNAWQKSELYEYNIFTSQTNEINLETIILARSLTYNNQKGLYINVIPMYEYKWFTEYDSGSWINIGGGIYKVENYSVSLIFKNTDGIFHSTFNKDGKLYATDTYGKVFVIENNQGKLLIDGLFNMLKNVCFSLDGKTMYITAFGGGVYRVTNWQ